MGIHWGVHIVVVWVGPFASFPEPGGVWPDARGHWSVRGTPPSLFLAWGVVRHANLRASREAGRYWVGKTLRHSRLLAPPSLDSPVPRTAAPRTVFPYIARFPSPDAIVSACHCRPPDFLTPVCGNSSAPVPVQWSSSCSSTPHGNLLFPQGYRIARSG
jgi:hypothetical protein